MDLYLTEENPFPNKFILKLLGEACKAKLGVNLPAACSSHRGGNYD